MLKLMKFWLAAMLLALPLHAAEINDFDTTDDNNTGRWPEGMPFANVNDAGRADEGILARFYKDVNGSITTAGSSNAYTVSANSTFTAYYTGMWVRAKASFTSTGAATLNVDSLGAKTITGSRSGSIVSGTIYDWVYDGTNFQQIAGISAIPAGSKSLFVQASCPTGWTQDTTHNNKALRLVSGTGAGTGGSTGFTSVMASRTPTGTVGGHTLTVNQMPLHGHPWRGAASSASSVNGDGGIALVPVSQTNVSAYTGSLSDTFGQQIGGTGGGQSHDHSWTGDAMDFAVLYVDVIICTKD